MSEKYIGITIQSLPEIRFAHCYQTVHYDVHQYIMPQRLEICHMQEGDSFVEVDGGAPIYYPPGRVYLFTYRKNIYAHSPSPHCRHVTVAFDTQYTETVLTRQDLTTYARKGSKNLFFVLPEEGLVVAENSRAESLLNQLISSYDLAKADQAVRTMSLLFELLALITEDTVNETMAAHPYLSPSCQNYVHFARNFILDNLSCVISPTEIAKQLGISVGYLNTIFKAVTGMSIIKYVNTLRVDRIKELLTYNHMTLREAGENVGITDENYCSRLFKQYTGQTTREFLGRHHLLDHDSAL